MYFLHHCRAWRPSWVVQLDHSLLSGQSSWTPPAAASPPAACLCWTCPTPPAAVGGHIRGLHTAGGDREQKTDTTLKTDSPCSLWSASCTVRSTSRVCFSSRASCEVSPDPPRPPGTADPGGMGRLSCTTSWRTCRRKGSRSSPGLVGRFRPGLRWSPGGL